MVNERLGRALFAGDCWLILPHLFELNTNEGGEFAGRVNEVTDGFGVCQTALASRTVIYLLLTGMLVLV